MSKMRYSGVVNPQGAFEDLRPMVHRLRQLQMRCRPFGHDYHAIAVALDALATTAFHFTRNPNFFNETGNGR